ncbi:alpha/beta fold hydrolase [Streptomyces sp. NBC_00859]|uniref:alpha/beta fold hydrolase n=1 Tax=Streptomyces sp. NBC_00859 TaxID=2903682 RepID=UPI00386ADE38|nr:alpha/beta hydrolase [Streptomyces sp. NBC_00859]
MYFETHDGTRLAYEDYGQGEPVVFVSGAMLNADMWEYQIPYFAERGYRCIAFDRRGHGRSGRPSCGYDTDSTADDLAALLTHLDLTGATLVGHSLGGAEVARYLYRHGAGRVARVVLLAAVLPYLKQSDDNPAGIPEAAFDALTAAVRADRPKWMSQQLQAYFATHLGNQVSPGQAALTLDQCLSASVWATLQCQYAVFHTDNREAVRAIPVPALVLHGGADISAPVEVTGRKTAELLPGCTYQEYPTAGHGIYVSHHGEINAGILEFIKN